MAFAQLSQVRLEYFERGEGPQRILFIHGFQASARIWHAVQDALPADLYTSIALNNRGAGASEAPPNDDDYGVPLFASDAFELVERLGWRGFTLVGHSLGGATVSQFAVDHPDLLQGLVLLDPADPDGREASREEVDRIVDQRVAARRTRRERGQRGGDGIDARHAGGDREWLRLLTADIEAAPEARLRGSMRSMYRIRLGDAVRTLPMPVLLVAGDADALIPLASMLRTWAKYPEGTGLHVWHGIGHSPNVDCPDELAALLRRFIEVTIPARHCGTADN